MFSEHNFTTCFPTGVWSMMVSDTATLNPKLIAVIEQLRLTENWRGITETGV